MVKPKDFSRLLHVFQVLFKANLIFKDFSRQSSIFKYFSSLCEPCTLTFFIFYGISSLLYLYFSCLMCISQVQHLGQLQYKFLWYFFPHIFSPVTFKTFLFHFPTLTFLRVFPRTSPTWPFFDFSTFSVFSFSEPLIICSKAALQSDTNFDAISKDCSICKRQKHIETSRQNFKNIGNNTLVFFLSN